MNNGGGSQEWLLNYLRSDLIHSMMRCFADTSCDQSITQLGPKAMTFQKVSALQNSLSFQFIGLPNTDPCNAASAALSWKTQFEIEACVPALYTYSREELARHFLGFVALQVSPLVPTSLTTAWSKFALSSIHTGEVASAQPSSSVPALHWYAVRGNSYYSELLLSTERGASVALLHHVISSDVCTTPGVAPTQVRFSRWNIQQITSKNWKLATLFTMICGTDQWQGEILWEVEVQNDSAMSTQQVLFRNLRM